MQRVGLGCVLAMLIASGFAANSASAAEPVPYVILQTTQGNSGGRCPVAGPQPQMIPAPAQPYAYGWFGAQGGTNYGRSFGYYRNYTQWRKW